MNDGEDEHADPEAAHEIAAADQARDGEEEEAHSVVEIDYDGGDDPRPLRSVVNEQYPALCPQRLG